ncbi:MAG TPA: hypothetical protein VFO21_20395 [Vicinamibacterales bacterium]|nr:hypothetical protein [Vicinamibacterales bacterium]
MTSVEGTLRTPLVDYFRRGEAPLDVRMLAARGVLAPRAHEQLELLVLLLKDSDADVSAAAAATLESIPVDALGAFLARADVSAELRSFFAARGVNAAAAPAPGDEPLIDTAPEPPAAPENEDSQSTLQRIAAMTVAQRIGVAMKGSREERAILIRDPNKIVAVAVLGSPKMTETEIEGIAKMASISDEILRMIANNRAWTKRYGIIAALARNPKTPVAISMNLLARLTEKDLRSISADRNVPEILRITARQKIVLNK